MHSFDFALLVDTYDINTVVPLIVFLHEHVECVSRKPEGSMEYVEDIDNI